MRTNDDDCISRSMEPLLFRFELFAGQPSLRSGGFARNPEGLEIEPSAESIGVRRGQALQWTDDFVFQLAWNYRADPEEI